MKIKIIFGILLIIIISTVGFWVYSKTGWESDIIPIDNQFVSSKVVTSVKIEGKEVDVTIKNKTHQDLRFQYTVTLYDKSKNELDKVGCFTFMERIFGVNAQEEVTDVCYLKEDNINITDIQYYKIQLSPSKVIDFIY